MLDSRVTATSLLPRPSLARLLHLHAAALPALVAGLAEAGAARLWPAWDEAARLAALAEDLRRPGLPGTGAARPARFASEAAAWGGLYALEGSRLGTKVVLRRLAAGGEPVGSAFLQYGGDAAGRWPEFLRHLDAALGPAEMDEARNGAALVMRRYLAAADRLGQAPRTGGDEAHAAARA